MKLGDIHVQLSDQQLSNPPRPAAAPPAEGMLNFMIHDSLFDILRFHWGVGIARLGCEK